MQISVLLFVVLFVSQACEGSEQPQSCVTCPEGWTFWGSACYRFFNNPKSTWIDAEANCNRYSLYQGRRLVGHLATITSSKENTFLLNLWKTIRSDTTVWLGYNDIKNEGNFVDVEGFSPKFIFWAPIEPNNLGGEDCVVMWNSDKNHDDGSWNDNPCESRYSFVCKIGR